MVFHESLIAFIVSIFVAISSIFGGVTETKESQTIPTIPPEPTPAPIPTPPKTPIEQQPTVPTLPELPPVTTSPTQDITGAITEIVPKQQTITEPKTVLPQTETTVTNVTIHFIDVGQGDAIFIDTNDKDVLIDSGTLSHGYLDVIPYLQKLNVTLIHILSASNHDADHMGGLVAVLEEIPVDTVWDSGSTKTTDIYSEFISLATKKNFILVKRGESFQLDYKTKVTVLNPIQPLQFTKENDNSIVLQVSVGQIDFLFAGDCELACEKSILASGLPLDSEILKVGHHGSKTSTSESFLAAISPEVAAIQVGANNRYGHPHEKIVTRLISHDVKIYRTDLHGNIFVTTDGNSYAISTTR